LLGLLEQTAFLQTKLVKTGVGFHLSVLAVPPLRSHRARRTLVAERALQVAIKMSSSRGRKRGTPPTSPSRAVKIPASAAAAASAPPPGARGVAGQLPDDAPEPAAPHGGSGSSSSCAAARPQRAKKAREIMGSAPVAAAPAPAGVKPQAVRFAAALLAYTKNGTFAEIRTLFDISPKSTNYYTKKFKKGEKYSELQVQTAKNMHADATAAAAAAADAADAAAAAATAADAADGAAAWGSWTFEERVHEAKTLRRNSNLSLRAISVKTGIMKDMVAELKFPKAAPKLMGLGTVRAVLEGKYGHDIAKLVKLKLNSLQDLLSPQLACCVMWPLAVLNSSLSTADTLVTMLNIFSLSFVHMAIVRRNIFTLGVCPLNFFSVLRNSGSRYASPSCHPQANRTGL
jgi:hypothetical protein